jgi:hypothetical protein
MSVALVVMVMMVTVMVMVGGINVEVTGILFDRWEDIDVIVNSRVTTAFDRDDHFFIM